MADVEPEFDVEKDLPEFLSSVLDRTEESIHNSETDINDLQAQSVVVDRTISLLSSIALTDIEQDRIDLEVQFQAMRRVFQYSANTIIFLVAFHVRLEFRHSVYGLKGIYT